MASDLKEKANRIIAQRGLCSCMNQTKWNELRNAVMTEMPFQPAYAVKFLFDAECGGETALQTELSHPCDWYYAYAIDGQCFDASFAIEWLKVRPSYQKSMGKYAAPKVISAEREFAAILQKYHIPFEVNDGVYCIYGYR